MNVMMHRSDPTATIRSLRSAAPYIRMFKGKVFVVKAGGGVFGDPEATRGLIEQIAILHYFGVRVVFVHGGGPQLTEITEALGVPTRMVQGRRITDQKSIDATSMVLPRLVNPRLHCGRDEEGRNSPEWPSPVGHSRKGSSGQEYGGRVGSRLTKTSHSVSESQ